MVKRRPGEAADNQRVKPWRLVFCSVFLASAMSAQPAGDSWPGNSPRRLVQSGEDVRIDWTEGAAYARATVQLPRIASTRSEREFDGDQASTSLTDARARAREQAREQAALRLTQALFDLQLDARHRLGEHVQQDRELRDRLGDLSDRFRVASRNTGEGVVTVTLALRFTGPEGLYSMLARSIYGKEPMPEAGPVDATDPISGVIVDLSEHPEFRPSLEPRIFSDRGRLIYGPETVSRACTVRRGLAAYHASVDRAREDRRVGQRPYYTYAGGLLGPGRSDIFLDAEDVERILGHQSGRTVLRRCGVVFVVNPASVGNAARQ